MKRSLFLKSLLAPLAVPFLAKKAEATGLDPRIKAKFRALDRKIGRRKARRDIVTDRYGVEILPGHLVRVGADLKPGEDGPVVLVSEADPEWHYPYAETGHWIDAVRVDGATDDELHSYWSHACEALVPGRRYGIGDLPSLRKDRREAHLKALLDMPAELIYRPMTESPWTHFVKNPQK